MPEHVTVGGVRLTVWENEGIKGKYHTVSLQRNYKDVNGDWQNTQSLRVNDIPKAVLALQKAYEKNRFEGVVHLNLLLYFFIFFSLFKIPH